MTGSTNNADQEWAPNPHAVGEEVRKMVYLRIGNTFLSDDVVFENSHQAAARWVAAEPHSDRAQRWWELFRAGPGAVAAAIGADTHEGRHLRSSAPVWLMPWPEHDIQRRRADWRAAKRLLIERHSGSSRDSFERWQELVDEVSAAMAWPTPSSTSLPDDRSAH